MNDSMPTRELVSDLMDGRLDGRALSHAVAEVAGTAEAREVWHSYHLVRDALRANELTPSSEDAGFLSRFQARLHADPAQHPRVQGDFPTSLIVPQGTMIEPHAKGGSAANDRFIPWKWVAGLASVLVVAAASWNMVRGPQGLGTEQQLAKADSAAPGTVLVETSNDGQVMIRDPRLDRLLMAHRQSAGQSALQVPSGFLRSATFEVSNHQDLPN